MPEKAWIVAIFAILALAIIEVSAIVRGVDGAILSLVVAAIAGLGGYVLPNPWSKPKQ